MDCEEKSNFLGREEALEIVEKGMKRCSYSSDSYEKEGSRGPGLYVVFTSEPLDPYHIAEDMKPNIWNELSEERTLSDNTEIFYEELGQVANSQDGAVLIEKDCEKWKLYEENVRIHTPPEIREKTDYTGVIDRGTKHRSAVEASNLDEIITTLTLSEEDGSVMRFLDGQRSKEHCYSRDEILEELEEWEKKPIVSAEV